jgi:DNA-binding GntR family transcriptional regulator
MVQTIVEALRKSVLTGQLPQGALLNQVALAKEFGVSRIPLREACRQLEAEGLLVFEPGRGAVVSPLSSGEIAEVVDLRTKIEPDLLANAIPRLSEDDLERASDILDEFEAALESGAVEKFGELNWRFHSTLYAPSGRALALGILENLHRLNQRYAGMQISLTKWETRAAREHRAILAACRRKDAAKAAQLLTDHITSAGGVLMAFLKDERNKAVGPQESSTKRS